MAADRQPSARERCEAIVFEAVQALDVARSSVHPGTEEAVRLEKIRYNMRVHLEAVGRLAYGEGAFGGPATITGGAPIPGRGGKDIPLDEIPNPKDSLEATEKWHVRRVILFHESMKAAAESLDVSNKTLWEKRRRWKLKDKPFRPSRSQKTYEEQ
jgi:hypothetical protein